MACMFLMLFLVFAFKCCKKDNDNKNQDEVVAVNVEKPQEVKREELPKIPSINDIELTQSVQQAEQESYLTQRQVH